MYVYPLGWKNLTNDGEAPYKGIETYGIFQKSWLYIFLICYPSLRGQWPMEQRVCDKDHVYTRCCQISDKPKADPYVQLPR